MTMRKTPYLRIRYPWASDVVSAADVQSLASDVDQALVQTALLSTSFSRMASVAVQRKAVQSIAASTVTAISFDTLVLDNGTDSPVTGANGAWYNATTPTRLTAPVACVVLASGMLGINYTSAAGATNCVQVMICLNGATGVPNVQGTKWNALSTATGPQIGSALSMWKLAAGDFLELKAFWRGTPAGPLNTDTTFPATLSLMMVALPAVP
jgi:hypothetical protein